MDGGNVLGGCDVLALSKLLYPKENATESGDSDLDEKPAVAAMTPGSVGPPRAPPATAAARSTSSSSHVGAATAQNKPKAIWADHEIQPLERTVLADDPRPCPNYEVVYKQSIGAEDVFLGMGNRTPSTASCEDMVIVIDVPNTKHSDMQLDVSHTFLDFETPGLKLGLPLPHPVDSANGKAKWDKNKSQLSVTLRMKREYDFMNF